MGEEGGFRGSARCVEYGGGKERSSEVTLGLQRLCPPSLAFSPWLILQGGGSLVIICSCQTGRVRSPAIQTEALPLAQARTYAGVFPLRQQQVKARHFITRLIWSFVMTQRGHTHAMTHVHVCRGCARGHVHMLACCFISFSWFSKLQKDFTPVARLVAPRWSRKQIQ